MNTTIDYLLRLKELLGAETVSLELRDNHVYMEVTYDDGFGFKECYEIKKSDLMRLNATDLFALNAMRARGAANEAKYAEEA